MELTLTNSEKKAIIDDRDMVICMMYNWMLDVHGYVKSTSSKCVHLHCFLMNSKGIDHKDGDPLNNRRDNLRKANQSQNTANSKKAEGCKSEYKGVTWQPIGRKWVAYICPNGRKIHLGSFVSEMDAAKAYDKAAIEHFGVFARLNFPEVTDGTA